jgi:hypothetical protein
MGSKQCLLQRFALLLCSPALHAVMMPCRCCCCCGAEVYLGQPYNEKADVFSFGVCLYGERTQPATAPHVKCITMPLHAAPVNACKQLPTPHYQGSTA